MSISYLGKNRPIYSQVIPLHAQVKFHMQQLHTEP